MSAKKWGGKRDKIGLTVGIIFFLILVIGAIVGSSNTGTNTNNKQSVVNTTSKEQASSFNYSSSQQTITTAEIEAHQSEIDTYQEIPNVMKQSLGEDIQVTINKTSTGLGVVAFVPPHYNLGLVTLGSNVAFTTFQTIFADDRFQSVSYVGIVFTDNFVDKYGNKSINIGLEYGVSRSTAEKIKDWHNYMDYSSNDPVGWFRSIMDPTKDMIYVNPVELKG